MIYSSPLPALIYHRLAAIATSKRYALNLSVNSFILLYLVKSYNTSGIKCGHGSVLRFFKSCGRAHSTMGVQLKVTYLVQAGLLLSVRPVVRRGGYNLNLHTTILGVQVLADFERLLLSYKIKGLAK